MATNIGKIMVGFGESNFSSRKKINELVLKINCPQICSPHIRISTPHGHSSCPTGGIGRVSFLLLALLAALAPHRGLLYLPLHLPMNHHSSSLAQYLDPWSLFLGSFLPDATKPKLYAAYIIYCKPGTN